MMSANDSPVCGRAAGMFSTFTASAGRFGTLPPFGPRPVRGQIGGGGGNEAPDGLTPTGRGGFAPPPPVQEARAAMATITAANRARLDDVMGRVASSGIGGSGTGVACYPRTEP